MTHSITVPSVASTWTLASYSFTVKVLQSKCQAASSSDMNYPTFGAENTQISSSSTVVASVPDYGTVKVAITNQGIVTLADCGSHTVTATDSSGGDVSAWV